MAALMWHLVLGDILVFSAGLISLANHQANCCYLAWSTDKANKFLSVLSIARDRMQTNSKYLTLKYFCFQLSNVFAAFHYNVLNFLPSFQSCGCQRRVPISVTGHTAAQLPPYFHHPNQTCNRPSSSSLLQSCYID